MINAESLDLEEFTIVVVAQEEADITETVDFAVQLRRPQSILLVAQDISVRMELTRFACNHNSFFEFVRC